MKYQGWKYLLRDVGSFPGVRGAMGESRDNLQKALAGVATLAWWISKYAPEIARQELCRVLVLEPAPMATTDEGRWYGLLPHLLGSKSLKVEVTIVGRTIANKANKTNVKLDYEPAAIDPRPAGVFLKENLIMFDVVHLAGLEECFTAPGDAWSAGARHMVTSDLALTPIVVAILNAAGIETTSVEDCPFAGMAKFENGEKPFIFNHIINISGAEPKEIDKDTETDLLYASVAAIYSFNLKFPDLIDVLPGTILDGNWAYLGLEYVVQHGTKQVWRMIKSTKDRFPCAMLEHDYSYNVSTSWSDPEAFQACLHAARVLLDEVAPQVGDDTALKSIKSRIEFRTKGTLGAVETQGKTDGYQGEDEKTGIPVLDCSSIGELIDAISDYPPMKPLLASDRGYMEKLVGHSAAPAAVLARVPLFVKNARHAHILVADLEAAPRINYLKGLRLLPALLGMRDLEVKITVVTPDYDFNPSAALRTLSEPDAILTKNLEDLIDEDYGLAGIDPVDMVWLVKSRPEGYPEKVIEALDTLQRTGRIVACGVNGVVNFHFERDRLAAERMYLDTHPVVNQFIENRWSCFAMLWTMELPGHCCAPPSMPTWEEDTEEKLAREFFRKLPNVGMAYGGVYELIGDKRLKSSAIALPFGLCVDCSSWSVLNCSVTTASGKPQLLLGEGRYGEVSGRLRLMYPGHSSADPSGYQARARFIWVYNALLEILAYAERLLGHRIIPVTGKELFRRLVAKSRQKAAKEISDEAPTVQDINYLEEELRQAEKRSIGAEGKADRLERENITLVESLTESRAHARRMEQALAKTSGNASGGKVEKNQRFAALSIELGERNLQVRNLERKLELLENRLAMQESARENNFNTDMTQEECDSEEVEIARDPSLPVYGKDFQKSLETIPRHIKAETLEITGELASGKKLAYTFVKKLKDSELFSARVGLGWRLIFDFEEDSERVRFLDVIPRESFDKWMTLHRKAAG